MKKTKKITFCAMMAALSAAFMLASYFPYLTYGVPAVSGLFVMIAVVEYGIKWGLFSYIASAVPVFLLAETESKLMYVFFFGFYPVVKALIERIRKNPIELILKLAVLNVSVLAVYLLFAGLFDISLEDFGALGKYGAYILLGFGNIVFVLYDIAVSRMAMFYISVIKPKLRFKM